MAVVHATDGMREQAVSFVSFARAHDVAKLDALVETDGERVRYIVERDLPAGDEDGPRPVCRAEQVTIKVGPQTKPRVVLCAPAAWLDGQPS